MRIQKKCHEVMKILMIQKKSHTLMKILVHGICKNDPIKNGAIVAPFVWYFWYGGVTS